MQTWRNFCGICISPAPFYETVLPSSLCCFFVIRPVFRFVCSRISFFVSLSLKNDECSICHFRSKTICSQILAVQALRFVDFYGKRCFRAFSYTFWLVSAAKNLYFNHFWRKNVFVMKFVSFNGFLFSKNTPFFHVTLFAFPVPLKTGKRDENGIDNPFRYINGRRLFIFDQSINSINQVC